MDVRRHAAYTFQQVGVFTPVVSGVIGYQTGSDDFYDTWNGFSDYWYYNAGLALDRRKADVRLPLLGHLTPRTPTSDTLTCINGYCDSRFVFTAKVVLP